MTRLRGVLSLVFFAVFLLMPLAAFAQDVEEPGGDPWTYVALVFNVGVVAALVQLLKLYVMPWLKEKAPYLIPIIGIAIGIAGALVLQATGIDLSPIGDLFGAGIASGALASAGFAVAKEAQNKLKRRKPKRRFEGV